MRHISIEKTIKEGNKQMVENYCIDICQLFELVKMSKSDFEKVYNGFLVGYIQGMKVQKKKQKAKDKKKKA